MKEKAVNWREVFEQRWILLVVSSKGKIIDGKALSILNILSKAKLLLGLAQVELYDVAVVREMKANYFESSLYFSLN